MSDFSKEIREIIKDEVKKAVKEELRRQHRLESLGIRTVPFGLATASPEVSAQSEEAVDDEPKDD